MMNSTQQNDANGGTPLAEPTGSRTCRTCKYWSQYLGIEDEGECRTESGTCRSWDFETCEGWEAK